MPKERFNNRSHQLNEMGLIYVNLGWSAPGANKEDIFISFSQISNYNEYDWMDLINQTWAKLGVGEHAMSPAGMEVA